MGVCELNRLQLMAQAQSLANWRAHKKLTLYVVGKVNNHLVFALSDKSEADDADERGHSQHCSGCCIAKIQMEMTLGRNRKIVFSHKSVCVQRLRYFAGKQTHTHSTNKQ